ncbi:hypothetical protein JCM10207_009007 [Rhodosporidiobolus poonsookiae]
MLLSTSLFTALLGLASCASARPARLSRTTQKLNVTFSDYTGEPGEDARAWLKEQGLVPADALISDGSPYNYRYDPCNVDIVDGVLRLKVTAGTDETGAVVGSQLETLADDVWYGTSKVVVKATETKGTCTSFGPKLDDNNEIVTLWLSSSYNEDNGSAEPGIHYDTRSSATDYGSILSLFWDDPTDGFYEYTTVWSADEVEFNVSGSQPRPTMLDSGIPTLPGKFVLNFYADGDPELCAGPPTEDAYLEVQSISLEYTAAA